MLELAATLLFFSFSFFEINNVVYWETTHHRETGQSSTVLGPNGLRFWGDIIHVCCLRRPSRQGPMRVATEIISGKYMV